MLVKMLEMMRSKLDGPQARHIPLENMIQALSFSGMTEDLALFKLNITLGGSLKLKNRLQSSGGRDRETRND